MADNKNQHFVPKAHLKPFSVDGEGKAIHLFNLDAGRAIPNAAVRKQCSHDYLWPWKRPSSGTREPARPARRTDVCAWRLTSA